MFTSANMGLTIWNLLTDLFDHTQLENNFVALDSHNHATGQGVQIPTGGLANGAVTTSKIASGAITSSLIANGAVGAAQLALGAGALQYASLNSGTTLQNGFYYDVQGPYTLTLPPVTAGAVIGIIADSGGGTPITGTSQVTVQTADGSLIWGRGAITGITSLHLGTVFSHVILMASGTGVGAYWLIVGGEKDSGWINASLSGVTAGTPDGSLTPAARHVGDRFWLKGGFTNTSGSTITAGTTLFSLPASVGPPAQEVGMAVTCSTQTSGTAGLYIAPGAIAWLACNLPNNGFVNIDGANYSGNG